MGCSAKDESPPPVTPSLHIQFGARKLRFVIVRVLRPICVGTGGRRNELLIQEILFSGGKFDG